MKVLNVLLVNIKKELVLNIDLVEGEFEIGWIWIILLLIY